MPNPAAAGIAMAGLGTTRPETAVIPPTGAQAGGRRSGHDCQDGVTATDVEAARQILQKHRRVCVPEPVCNGCLATWPCADVVWAWHVLPDEE
jgi:hypothetical protein